MNMPINAFLGATDQAVSFPRQRPRTFDNAVASISRGRMLAGRRPCRTRCFASVSRQVTACARERSAVEGNCTLA
jgi:hypothetical protein